MLRNFNFHKIRLFTQSEKKNVKHILNYSVNSSIQVDLKNSQVFKATV